MAIKFSPKPTRIECGTPAPPEIAEQHERMLDHAFAETVKAHEAEAKRTRAPNGTFDRRAYQRDLMRKRRKAEKENAPK
jgi:hypothetical protein